MIIFFAATIIAFAFSLIAKLLVDAFLHTPFHIIGDFAGLYPTHNPGIAFGMRFPGGVQEALILIALALVVYAAVRSERSLMGDIGYGLIVGGALGNVLDRLRDGLVTDFFQIGSFAIFNVADSCISIGVALLLAQSLISIRHNRLK